MGRTDTGRGRSNLWGTLRVPGFGAYFVARGLAMVGATMTPLALAFAVLGAGRSGSFLGLVLAAQTAPQLLLVLLGGVAGDRVPRKVMLASTSFVMGGCQAATAGLLLTGNLSLPLVMTLQAGYGTARAFFTPANTGVVPDLVPAARIHEATTLVTLSRSVAFIVGPALAGGLLAMLDAGYVVLVDALLFFVGVGLIVSLPLSRRVVKAEESVLSSLKSGWQEFAGRSWIWSMVASFGFYQGCILPAMFVVGPVLASRPGGMGSGGWGSVLAAQGVGAVVGSALLLWWRPRRPLLASNLLVGLETLFLVPLAFVSDIGVVAVLAGLGSIGVTAADALWLSTLQREIPSDVLSRVSSYEWLGSLALNPLGMAVTGALVGIVAPTAILLVIACLNVVVRLLVLLAPGVRLVRSHPVAAVPAPV